MQLHEVRLRHGRQRGTMGFMKKISTGFSGANIKKFSGHFQKRLTQKMVVPEPTHDHPSNGNVLCCEIIKEATIFTTSHLFQSLWRPSYGRNVVTNPRFELFLQRDLIFFNFML